SAKGKTLHISWFTTRNRKAILQPVAVQRVADMMPDQLGRQLAFTFPSRFKRPQTAESRGASEGLRRGHKEKPVMTQEKRLAVAVMLVLTAGLTQALPTRAQGSSWESSSKKGKAKDSGMMLAKETGPAPAAASVPLVNPDEYIVGESD